MFGKASGIPWGGWQARAVWLSRGVQTPDPPVETQRGEERVNLESSAGSVPSSVENENGVLSR